MIVGEKFVGETIVGEMIVGEMNQTPCTLVSSPLFSLDQCFKLSCVLVVRIFLAIT
jgi:hypothetical protein